jgi:hypothetical protein
MLCAGLVFPGALRSNNVMCATSEVLRIDTANAFFPGNWQSGSIFPRKYRFQIAQTQPRGE